MKKFIGVDLGGTNLRAALVDPDTGAVSRLISVPTLAREGHDAVMARIVGLIETVIAGSREPKSAAWVLVCPACSISIVVWFYFCRTCPAPGPRFHCATRSQTE